MGKLLMEVAVTRSVSHIEGVSAKAFTEDLHCDVLKLFTFGDFCLSSACKFSSWPRFPQNGSSLKAFIVVIVVLQSTFLRLTL